MIASVLIDLHVHTSRYSPCAELMDPDKLLQAAVSCGLQGLVVSDHDFLWNGAELQALQDQSEGRLRLFRGFEASCLEGHFVVIGAEDLHGHRPGDSLIPLARHVHAEGGIVIAAHPYRQSLLMDLNPFPEAFLEAIDAVETVNATSTTQQINVSLHFAARIQRLAVGGSDAHYPEAIGAACTRFVTLPVDEQALARAIHLGHAWPDSARPVASRMKPPVKP